MKTRIISAAISTGISLALLSFGIGASKAHAAATPLENAGDQFAQAQLQPVLWEHGKVEKLQHAYHLLEQADSEYGGHKLLAMKSIKKASEVLGVEVHGTGHWKGEGEWNSDRKLREAKHLLEDLAVETGGGEEQAHLHRAIKEIDRSLALK